MLESGKQIEVWRKPTCTGCSSGTIAEAKYVRDAMGRVTSYTEYDTTSDTPTVAVYSRTAAYNNKSQVTSDSTTVVRTDATWTSNTTYDYKADTNGDGDYVDAGDLYQGGVVTHQRVQVLKNGNDGATGAEDTDTKSTFVWWGSAQAATTTYDKDVGNGSNALWVSTYNYDATGNLQQVYIADGTPRTIGFVTDADGFVIARDEVYNSGGNSPHERHYYFNGVQLGDIGNNGTSDIDYAASIARHQAVPGTGKFMLGATSGTSNTDFDQSYDPINGLNYANTASHYTVQDGDTLASIAYQIWGDSSYWYLIADANGLSGDETLVGGQNLIIPNKVHNSHNSSDTYKVYDPNEAIGDTSPTHRKPPKPQHAACGGFGQVLVTIIAVAVAAIIAGPLAAALAPSLGTVGGAIVGGAIAGAAGSVVGQGVGLALGIQSKLDWGQVAIAAISSGVNGGLAASGAFSSLGPTLGGALRGITASILTQGISVATGLQSKFDWASVAAAGVTSGVAGYVGSQLQGVNFTNDSLGNVAARGFISGMAGAIAGATAATVLNGKDFGDNLLANLPNAIGATIGNVIADSMAVDNLAGQLQTLDSTLPNDWAHAVATYNVTGDPTDLEQMYDAVITSSSLSPTASVQTDSSSTLPSHLTGLHLTFAQYVEAVKNGLWSQMQGDQSLTAIKNQAQVIEATRKAEAVPDAFAQSMSTLPVDSAITAFVRAIALITATRAPLGGGGQNFEKYLTFGSDESGIFISSISAGGAQGAHIFDLLKSLSGTIAVAHVHYINGTNDKDRIMQPPNSADDVITKIYNIPTYVIGGTGQNVWEIARQNGVIKIALVYPDNSLGSWEPFDKGGNYRFYNWTKYR